MGLSARAVSPEFCRSPPLILDVRRAAGRHSDLDRAASCGPDLREVFSRIGQGVATCSSVSPVYETSFLGSKRDS